MVARAAADVCGKAGDDVVAASRETLDITKRDAVLEFIDDVRPDAVLNCAAFTDVDGAETKVEACFAANADGVEHLAEACREFDAAFVTISTDYVFNGSKNGFYTENDEPDAHGIYARSKLEGEQRAAAANPSSVIVRSGWIYGKGGTNFLSVMPRLLAEGRSITAISDSFGTPTYAVDLAACLRELALLQMPGVFHVTNEGEGTSYLGFAEKVCEIGGFPAGLITPVGRESLKRPAPRPVNSRLKSLRLPAVGLAPMPDWVNALKRFLQFQALDQ